MPGLCFNSSMLLNIRQALEILPKEIKNRISTTVNKAHCGKDTRKFTWGRDHQLYLQYLWLLISSVRKLSAVHVLSEYVVMGLYTWTWKKPADWQAVQWAASWNPPVSNSRWVSGMHGHAQCFMWGLGIWTQLLMQHSKSSQAQHCLPKTQNH